MPNKQITDLDPLVGGMDDTYNFWTQKDGGGAGSSFQMAWSKLFLAKDAAAASGGNGTDINIAAGAGDGPGGEGGNVSIAGGSSENYGGDVTVAGGAAGNGGNLYLRGGAGDYGGDTKVYGGSTGDYGGHLTIGGGDGTSYEGGLYMKRLPTINPGGVDRVWRDAGVLKIN